MNRRLKQIVISATIVAFTACGGGGGGESTSSNTETPSDNTTRGESSSIGHGSRPKKKTTSFADGESSLVEEYNYNSEGMLSKWVHKVYMGGIMQKSIMTMTYIDVYKTVKTIIKYYTNDELTKTAIDEYTYDGDNTKNHIVKTYNVNDELIGSLTEKYTYDGDNLISEKSENKNFIDSDKSFLGERNTSNYVDGTPTITTFYTYNTGTMKYLSKGTTVMEVIDEKITSKTTTEIDFEHDNKTTVSTKTYEYDSLNRRTVTTVIDDNNIPVSFITTYVTDTSKIAPEYPCFGKYAELEKIRKNEYPKSENLCGLIQKVDTITKFNGEDIKGSGIWEHTFNDNGLVIETKITNINSGVVEMISTYEYETY